MHPALFALVLSGGVLLSGLRPCLGQSATEVKAAFLPKLAAFATWPTNAFSDSNAPIIIGVLGKNPFDRGFASSLSTAKVRGRPLELREFTSVSDATNCHVLFVSAAESGRDREIVRMMQEKPILVVADFPRFAEHGGIMNFVLIEEKVRFEINHAAAERSGLSLDARLLGVSRLVKDGRPAGAKRRDEK